MTKQLQMDDSGSEYIQFRGAQSSVTLDDYPVVFEMERREYGDMSILCHSVYPVVGPDGAMTEEEARNGDEAGLWHEIATKLVETNPLTSYGVACECDGCDAVFDTPRGLTSHMQTHTEDTDETDEDIEFQTSDGDLESIDTGDE